MDIRHNFILIHIGNSDVGFLLLQELYRLQNHLVVVSKCEKLLRRLKKEFPKIDRVVCDVNQEEEFNSLIKRCQNVYPFLDLLIHHNFDRDLPTSIYAEKEIQKSILEAKKITIGLLPNLKSNSSILLTAIYAKKLSPKETNYSVKDTFDSILTGLEEKAIQFHQITIPIHLLKLNQPIEIKQAKRQIDKLLAKFEKGQLVQNVTKKSSIKGRLKKLILVRSIS